MGAAVREGTQGIHLNTVLSFTGVIVSQSGSTIVSDASAVPVMREVYIGCNHLPQFPCQPIYSQSNTGKRSFR